MTYCFNPVIHPQDSSTELRLQYLSGVYMTMNNINPNETYNVALQNSSLIAWVDTEDEAFLYTLVAKASPEEYNKSKYFVGEFTLEIGEDSCLVDREHQDTVDAMLKKHGYGCLADAFYDASATVRMKNLRRITM